MAPVRRGDRDRHCRLGGALDRRFQYALVPLAPRHHRAACVVVPGAKLVVAATLMSRPDSRPFGAGLLASLGTGFLVLVGTCAASLTRAQ